MKTRKSTQAAFTQPEVSWSRKRSLRIVIRIQIQITKKKTSKTTRRASPKLMSANGKVNPFADGWDARQLTSADDDLAVHEGMDPAVIGERPLLPEANRGRLAALDATGVEGPLVGRRVGGAGGVGENHPRPHVDSQGLGGEFEVVDRDRPRAAGQGRSGTGSGRG